MNIFTDKNSFIKHLYYGESINPARDWFVLLTLSTIILTGIIVWNVWAFDTVANGGVIGTSATSTPQVFNKSSLDDIYTIFANRAIEKEKYDRGIYNFTDPSQ